MNDFEKGILDALAKLTEAQERALALAARTDERIEKIAGHWDRSEERAIARQEVDARHLFLREREHSEKYENDVRAEAVRRVNSAAQGMAWALDVEGRSAMRKKFDELDAIEARRQQRNADREDAAKSPGSGK